MNRNLVFKIATEPHEFEQIHALNFRTFVEEIPQHAADASRRLVDRKHAENTYLICLDAETLVAMVALRSRRPFSLDEKLPALDGYLPLGRKPCEIRLLSILPAYRNSAVLVGLIARLFGVARTRGYDLALISGTTRQLRLYAHLGFVPFGPLVGSAEARYQPMMLTLERFERTAQRLIEGWSARGNATVSFLPGPVEIAPEVRAAFAAQPLSHRGEAFARKLTATRRGLLELTGARHAAVLLGSGTLANDAVAAQLALHGDRGLVLSNGEFGERLVEHATRWRLRFDVHRKQWGEPFNLEEIAATRAAWVWVVHCETSTGMLNDLDSIRALCSSSGARLCVDAISSLGTVPVSLAGVAFATGVSGKGLGAYPGLALVLHDQPVPSAPTIPRYLDLAAYRHPGEVPFTHSSNLVDALHAALARFTPERYERIHTDAVLLRGRLAEHGFSFVAPEPLASPAVLTIALPSQVSSCAVGAAMARLGYAIGYQSGYLVRRNWIQIALMGVYSRHHLADLAAMLSEAAAYRPLDAALCAASGMTMSSVGVATFAARANASGATS
jgi:aspartate aminotransferase-like enzyme/GNAT superfamily N-acetyltransferase